MEFDKITEEVPTVFASDLTLEVKGYGSPFTLLIPGYGGWAGIVFNKTISTPGNYAEALEYRIN